MYTGNTVCIVIYNIGTRQSVFITNICRATDMLGLTNINFPSSRETLYMEQYIIIIFEFIINMILYLYIKTSDIFFLIEYQLFKCAILICFQYKKVRANKTMFYLEHTLNNNRYIL